MSIKGAIEEEKNLFEKVCVSISKNDFDPENCTLVLFSLYVNHYTAPNELLRFFSSR